MPARKIDPKKDCAACGVPLVRRRKPSGGLEDPSLFATRRFCSIVCANRSKPSETRNGGPCPLPLSELLERHIVREPNSGCWLWTGDLRKGYARLRVGRNSWKGIRGRTIPVHRHMYEQHIGPIPSGLVPDHKCRTRCCVNPWHLEPVTNLENILRGEAARQGRRKAYAPRQKRHVMEMNQ